MWTLWCWERSRSFLKHFPQWAQANGFSFEWVLLCSLRLFAFANNFSQTLHWNFIVTDLGCRFDDPVMLSLVIMLNKSFYTLIAFSLPCSENEEIDREWGNRKRMRKWTENEEINRECGNRKRMRKWTENEEMDREWGNRQRMRKWTENEEINREWGNGQRMRKSTENEEIIIIIISYHYYWSELWTNFSRTWTLEGMVHGTCIILMRHASIHRMNQKQWRDFKRRRANLALLMKNNEETSKEEEQTWLCWCLNKDILFLMCCSLLAASIYGLSRECRENLNIRCMRKWFWIRHAARKPRNSRSPDLCNQSVMKLLSENIFRMTRVIM